MVHGKVWLEKGMLNFWGQIKLGSIQKQLHELPKYTIFY